MAISKEELTSILQNKFPGALIKLYDDFGDGEKYRLFIRSSQFNDLTKVKQHQLVMQALEPTLQNKLHAISIKIIQ